MLRLRLATQEDCDLLFVWANDVECRKNSFSQKKIDYDTHVRWFRAHLQDEKSDLFLAVEDSVEIGMLRLDYEQNQALISYSVAAKERKKGYGKKILQLAEIYVKNDKEHIQILTGKVKNDNVISMHIFEELGYEKQECEDYIQYTKSYLNECFSKA